MMKSHTPYRTNLILFALILIIVGFGLNVLLASSSFLGRISHGDTYYYVKKQAAFSLLGVVLMILVSQIHYDIWKKFAWPLLGISMFTLLLVFVPVIGKKAGGAYRWINLGPIGFQPSDLARFSMIAVLARIYSVDQTEKSSWMNILITLAVCLAPAVLIALEPDFGTAMQLVFTAGTILFLTEFPLKIMALLGFLAIPVVYKGIVSEPYRWERLRAFLDPYKFRFEGAYQLVASFKAFQAGGFWGQGFGEGIRRHNLQARHTDFILAVVAEDLGVAGVFLLIGLFTAVATIALLLLMKVKDPFARLLGSGILITMMLQTLMNAAVTMGLVPTTGINLPLISYGGTSLVMYLVMMGIVLSILREAPAEQT